MKRATFRLRLAIHTTLVAGVLVTGVGAAAWWYARQQLAQNLDLRTLDTARRLWSQLSPRMNAVAVGEVARATFGDSFTNGSTALLMQSHAKGNPVIFASGTSPADGFASRLPEGEGVVTSEDPRTPERMPPAVRGSLAGPQMPEIRPPAFFDFGDWRYVALSSPRFTVFTALSRRDFYAGVRRAAWMFAGVGGVALALAGFGAWWLAGRAMRPLDRIVATAEQLQATALGEPIPIEPRDDREFARLIAVLNAMMERLHASFQQANRFTADASHELKTPLSVMHATLHDALRSGQPPPLETLIAEVSRLKSITQSLLLLSQADAGKLPLHRERYDLSAELDGLAEDADALCSAAGLRCEHTIAPGLEVEADRALMRQVFRNLLSNAVKYNHPGGSVTLSLRREASRAIFSITNTGPGIPPAMQPHLFQRFFRADQSRHSEGTGLGLNIATELARANGAELTLAEATEGRTTFVLKMPCPE